MVEKTKKRTQRELVWKRYKKNKLSMAGMIVVATLLFLTLYATFFVDYELAINQDMQKRFLSPSLSNLLGTDQYGRDMFLRMLFGARISILVALGTVFVSMIGGSFVGAVAGFYGGRIDNILMRIMDVFLAIPNTLLAISIVAALGQGITNLLIALAVSQIPSFARIVRSSTLTLKGQDYIEAARVCGTSELRIILKHILPNVIGPITVQSTLNVARSILNISSLSFIGLGISPPTPEWGSMLAEAKSQMRYYPHLIMVPGAAIAMTVMAFNLIGDGLRDALDPRLKN